MSFTIFYACASEANSIRRIRKSRGDPLALKKVVLRLVSDRQRAVGAHPPSDVTELLNKYILTKG